MPFLRRIYRCIVVDPRLQVAPTLSRWNGKFVDKTVLCHYLFLPITLSLTQVLLFALRNVGLGHASRHAFSDILIRLAHTIVYNVKLVLHGVRYPKAHGDDNGSKKKKSYLAETYRPLR